MKKFNVIDSDGFLVKTFATREQAEEEIRLTLEQWRERYETASREGNNPILNIVEEDPN